MSRFVLVGCLLTALGCGDGKKSEPPAEPDPAPAPVAAPADAAPDPAPATAPPDAGTPIEIPELVD